MEQEKIIKKAATAEFEKAAAVKEEELTFLKKYNSDIKKFNADGGFNSKLEDKGDVLWKEKFIAYGKAESIWTKHKKGWDKKTQDKNFPDQPLH